MKTNENPDFGRLLSGLVKIHQLAEGQKDIVRLEYLYYTDLDLKGEALVEDLKKLNYSGEVDATGRKCDCTRVYGETSLLENNEENIKNWYLEMRDVGCYHGCDFICYSIIENPLMKTDEIVNFNQVVATAEFEERVSNVMSIDDILNNKQVVNEEKFEQGKEAQEVGSQVVLDIMRNLGDRETEELTLDFFFYTDERSKAESLAEVLRKFGYDLTIHEDGKRDLKFSIIGQTIPLPNEDDVILNWCRKMNELGYIHDCAFDGWGTPVAKGDWFSDDTPEDELRKRLGLPPLEE